MKFNIVIAVLICALLSGVTIRHVMPLTTENATTSQSMDAYNNNASVSLIGEFRSSISGYLWDKSEEYLHSGVRLRTLTKNEAIAGSANLASSSDGLEQHHNETSVIPNSSNDPRWLWGDIERSVRPWFDVSGHKHRNPTETIPLFRFMTWLDPHFIPGYLVGANIILFAGNDKISQAMSFISEGMNNNPHSIALPTEYARYLITKKKDLSGAVIYLLKAISNSEKEINGELEKTALVDSYRWLVLTYRDLGNHKLAQKFALRANSLFPHDPIFQRILSNESLKKEIFSPEQEHHH